MVFYNENLNLYLETDVLEVSLGSSHLQERDRMYLPRNEALNNAVLWAIVFTAKA